MNRHPAYETIFVYGVTGVLAWSLVNAFLDPGWPSALFFAFVLFTCVVTLEFRIVRKK